ncbi:phosphoenolpyruvate carboxykinase [Campylobacter sp. MIT 99-7217]|uniref:IMPACT family protein n=1 Tax=Campylobacter sp. MIT 99-7217 TaxID=535091 RepID=UPI001158152D|nr:YigZ family protein [Campylobacter sp. MIT 99-7217]TQR32472.1 phosphoenolpyruvate carboxykinase [Campylobacter sp. MIT 99-7217]
MKTICSTKEARIEVKKSSFIAFLCAFKEFKTLLLNLKKEHPKAVHFVYAYRFLNELGQIIEDKSDDNEPRGTAGMPCLNTLRGALLVDSAVIVVRYFGGIKLGTGGLVRAYSDACNAVIKDASLQDFELKKYFTLEISLSLLAKFEHFFNKENIIFTKNFRENDILLKLELSPKEKEKLVYFLQNQARKFSLQEA